MGGGVPGVSLFQLFLIGDTVLHSSKQPAEEFKLYLVASREVNDRSVWVMDLSRGGGGIMDVSQGDETKYGKMHLQPVALILVVDDVYFS